MIAESTRISREDVYRILRHLQEQDIVESTISKPTTFCAITIDKMLDVLLTQASTRLQTIRAVKEELLKELMHFKGRDEAGSPSRFKIIHGMTNVYSIIASMIDSARSEILFLADCKALGKIYYSQILDILAKVTIRGVKIMCLTEVSHSDIEIVKNYSEYAEIRHTEISDMNVLVTDNSGMLIFPTEKQYANLPNKSHFAFYLDSEHFATGMNRLLKETWGNAVDSKARIRALNGKKIVLQDASSNLRAP